MFLGYNTNGFAHHRLHQDVAILRAASCSRNVQLREAVQRSARLPSSISFIVPVVWSRLRHSEGECWPHENVATVVCAQHRIDLRRILRMKQSRCDENEK